MIYNLDAILFCLIMPHLDWKKSPQSEDKNNTLLVKSRLQIRLPSRRYMLRERQAYIPLSITYKDRYDLLHTA